MRPNTSDKSVPELIPLLKEIKSSSYYCQNFEPQLLFKQFKQIKVRAPSNRESQFIAKCPEIKFCLTPELQQKIQYDINKSRKTKSGLFSSYECNRFKHVMSHMHYASSQEDEDIGRFQDAEDAFSVGFVVQKEANNYESFVKRLSVELKKCMDRKFQIVFEKNNNEHDSESQLNAIEKAVYKNLRLYLVLEPQPNRTLIVNKLMYYPDVKFGVKPIKIVPGKFAQNSTYQEALSFKSKFNYGYLSLSNNPQTKERRFLFIDKLDPELNENAPPIIGVWISAEHFQSKEQQRHYFWAVIMEYLRNPSIKTKLSVNFQKSGFVFTIEKPQKITPYLFELADSAKWKFKYEQQHVAKLPEQYSFSDQDVIMEEDRQESDMESVQNRSIMKNESQHQNFFEQNSHSKEISRNTIGQNASHPSQSQERNGLGISVENQSVKSNDERDIEIKMLKRELEMYKSRCEMLEKTMMSYMNNPQLLQFQAMQQMANMPFPGQFPNQLMPMGFTNQVPSNQISALSTQYQQSQNSLAGSRASTQNNERLLNESDLYEEEAERVPEPVDINRDQSKFQKKRTFEEDQIPAARSEWQKAINQPSAEKQKCLHQRESGQKTAKARVVHELNSAEYDLKNISFAQDSSFDSDINTTHRFPSFDISESDIFGKSPEFKKFSSVKESSTREQSNVVNLHEFSFDRKNDDLVSSTSRRESGQKHRLPETQKELKDVRPNSMQTLEGRIMNMNQLEQKYLGDYEKRFSGDKRETNSHKGHRLSSDEDENFGQFAEKCGQQVQNRQQLKIQSKQKNPARFQDQKSDNRPQFSSEGKKASESDEAVKNKQDHKRNLFRYEKENEEDQYNVPKVKSYREKQTDFKNPNDQQGEFSNKVSPKRPELSRVSRVPIDSDSDDDDDVKQLTGRYKF